MPLAKISLNDLNVLIAAWRRGALKPYYPSIIGGLGTVVFLIITLGLWGGISPRRDRVAQAESKLEILGEKYEFLIELQSARGILSEDAELLDIALPSEDAVPALMTQVQRIASESGVRLQALQFGGGGGRVEGEPEVEAVGQVGSGESLIEVGVVSLQAVAEGPFVNIRIFLYNLERAVRLISVEEVRFSTASAGGTSGRLVATLRLSSAYLSSKSPGTVESPLQLSLSDPEFLTLMDFLKTLRVYEPQAPAGPTGKTDPFQ